MPKKENYLSASRIKTLEGCSWLYWVKYHLKLPDITNHGALRGTICHNILELLLKPRHKKHFDKIIEDRGIKEIPSVNKMAVKFLKKNDAFTDENYDLVSKMIFVACDNDFFGKDAPEIGSQAHIEEPEVGFEIKNKSPKYNIKGFIDKPIEYKKEKLLRIVDYKSSKMKFRGEELNSNVQALMYSLAARSLWPKLKPRMEFLFLKFPKQPYQVLEYSQEQLKGFEYYLEQVQSVIDDFDEESAKTNFALDGGFKTKWMCGPTKSGWECPYKKPFTYYAKKDEEGNVVKTSFENDLSAGEKEKVEKMEYEGCPRFYGKEVKKDPFNLN
tara:strand:+ start:3773 stop:4756 length:984 start_codon:yes stop_codon:yes gene_type:complete